MAATSDAPREIALTIREATAADLSAIVAKLADDPLGRKRESPDDLAPYREAFAAVETDPNQLLVVAEREGAVVGTVQLSFLPGLSRRGALRAQIEAVRVRGDQRAIASASASYGGRSIPPENAGPCWCS